MLGGELLLIDPDNPSLKQRLQGLCSTGSLEPEPEPEL